jgi:hypothetical protein
MLAMHAKEGCPRPPRTSRPLPPRFPQPCSLTSSHAVPPPSWGQDAQMTAEEVMRLQEAMLVAKYGGLQPKKAGELGGQKVRLPASSLP